jgi:hypothetical protein
LPHFHQASLAPAEEDNVAALAEEDNVAALAPAEDEDEDDDDVNLLHCVHSVLSMILPHFSHTHRASLVPVKFEDARLVPLIFLVLSNFSE